MDKSEIFSRPLIIYDDKCYSCTKFANVASALSRGYIRIAGHYYSNEAIWAKKIVFPATYEPSEMFWLINRNGAYGARCGLLQVIKEIILASIKRRHMKNETKKPEYKYNCQIDSCGTSNTFKRVVTMMMNSRKFSFHDK
jgi:hypothetical protein